MERLFKQPGYALRFSDDGSLLLCIGRQIALIDVPRGERVWAVRQLKNPSDGSFSPDGKTLAVKDTSGRIVILHARSGKLSLDLKNQREGEGCGVHFSPDGKEIIDGSWEGLFTIRSAKTGTSRSREEFPAELIERISHDKTRRLWLIAYCPGYRPGEPRNAPTHGYVRFRKWPFVGASQRILRLPVNMEGATLHPDGKTFCFTDLSPISRLYIARISDGSILAKSAPLGQDSADDIAWWSPTGEIIAAAQQRGFIFYRSSDLAILGEVPAEYASSVAFRPGTQEVALGTWNESIIVQLSDILKGRVKLN